VVEALRRAGPHPTRATLRTALESLKGFDLGIGQPLEFGPQRHQGLDSVYFTRVDGERWVPITDWNSALRA
jgi:branched-chain amino acid transport system substrate-binding protein